MMERLVNLDEEHPLVLGVFVPPNVFMMIVQFLEELEFPQIF